MSIVGTFESIIVDLVIRIFTEHISVCDMAYRWVQIMSVVQFTPRDKKDQGTGMQTQMLSVKAAWGFVYIGAKATSLPDGFIENPEIIAFQKKERKKILFRFRSL